MLTKEDRKAIKAAEQEYKRQIDSQRRELKRQNSDPQIEKKRMEKDKNVKRKGSEKTPTKKIEEQKKVLSVFPIRDYRDDVFITEDNGIIDLFQIQGRSFFDASDDEVETLVYNFTRFLRKYHADMKFISMNYPTNTKLQQAFLMDKLKQPELEKFEDLLNEKLAELQELEQTTTDREAFIMVFAHDRGQYDSLCHVLANIGSFSVKSISREKKENIIFQLNNMNKHVKI